MVPRRLPRLAAGLPRRACMVCGMLHSYIPYYNRTVCADLCSVRRGVSIWYVLEVLRRCNTLQRGAGGIIAAYVELVL